MPIYEYKCQQCDNIFEEWIKSHVGTEQADCPNCGAVSKQIMSNTSFVLKGGGWYVTEYGNRKNQENNGDSTSNPKPDATVKPSESEKNTTSDDTKVAAPKLEQKVTTDSSATANKTSPNTAAV